MNVRSKEEKDPSLIPMKHIKIASHGLVGPKLVQCVGIPNARWNVPLDDVSLLLCVYVELLLEPC